MTGIPIVDLLLILAVIVLTPTALAMLLLVASAAVTAVSDVGSRRRMRRHLDELIRERV